jgi:hypothetical protein
VVEQRIRNARVVGSIPTTGLLIFLSRAALIQRQQANTPKSLARNDAHVFAPKRNFFAKFLPSAWGEVF